LAELQGKSNRNAQFRTVIALILGGKEYLFEGDVKGLILQKEVGDLGFGYDGLFQPDGYEISFAQMPFEEKNRISHRAMAMAKLSEFLNK
jgi:XTP/dITP diphosphohydrolase